MLRVVMLVILAQALVARACLADTQSVSAEARYHSILAQLAKDPQSADAVRQAEALLQYLDDPSQADRLEIAHFHFGYSGGDSAIALNFLKSRLYAILAVAAINGIGRPKDEALGWAIIKEHDLNFDKEGLIPEWEQPYYPFIKIGHRLKRLGSPPLTFKAQRNGYSASTLAGFNHTERQVLDLDAMKTGLPYALDLQIMALRNLGWSAHTVREVLRETQSRLRTCGVALDRIYLTLGDPGKSWLNDKYRGKGRREYIDLPLGNFLNAFFVGIPGNDRNPDTQFETGYAGINKAGYSVLFRNPSSGNGFRMRVGQTFTHELGHNLGLPHPLTFQPSIMSGGGLDHLGDFNPQFTEDQCQAMHRHYYLRPNTRDIQRFPPGANVPRDLELEDVDDLFALPTQEQWNRMKALAERGNVYAKLRLMYRQEIAGADNPYLEELVNAGHPEARFVKAGKRLRTWPDIANETGTRVPPDMLPPEAQPAWAMMLQADRAGYALASRFVAISVLRNAPGKAETDFGIQAARRALGGPGYELDSQLLELLSDAYTSRQEPVMAAFFKGLSAYNQIDRLVRLSQREIKPREVPQALRGNHYVNEGHLLKIDSDNSETRMGKNMVKLLDWVVSWDFERGLPNVASELAGCPLPKYCSGVGTLSDLQ